LSSLPQKAIVTVLGIVVANPVTETVLFVVFALFGPVCLVQMLLLLEGRKTYITAVKGSAVAADLVIIGFAAQVPLNVHQKIRVLRFPPLYAVSLVHVCPPVVVTVKVPLLSLYSA
jgi:hypothetical protein